jgi:erythromycin esterase
MRSEYLVLLAFVFPAAMPGQNAPIEPFQQWARQHVHPISSVDQDTQDNADLRVLSGIIGDAHVVAFGEPFHGGHEPLAMRNRLIRYAVTQLGFTAVALETGLTTSKRVYDHVLGKTTETDSTLKEGFSYGFGRYPENLELIQWLRTWNAAQPAARQVHFYGIDLAGQQHYPYAYRSVEAVLNFVNHAAPGLGRELHQQYAGVISVFRSDKYAALTPSEKDALTGKIQEMIALLRRERVPLIAATSRDEYDWALREAVNASQDDAYLRSLPTEFDPEQFDPSPQRLQPKDLREGHQAEMREIAMADNLQWVQQRESSRGKVFFFAHDGHVLSGIQTFLGPHPDAPRFAGNYLRSMLGRDMVVVGTYFGHGEGFPAERMPLPPDAAGTDGMLSSLSIPTFMMDLRELPGSGILHEWFQAAHETHAWPIATMVAPLEAYDAILFIETITPTPAPPKN